MALVSGGRDLGCHVPIPPTWVKIGLSWTIVSNEQSPGGFRCPHSVHILCLCLPCHCCCGLKDLWENCSTQHLGHSGTVWFSSTHRGSKLQPEQWPSLAKKNLEELLWPLLISFFCLISSAIYCHRFRLSKKEDPGIKFWNLKGELCSQIFGRHHHRRSEAGSLFGLFLVFL